MQTQASNAEVGEADIIHCALKLDFQTCFWAHGKLGVKRELHPLGIGVVRNVRGFESLLCLCLLGNQLSGVNNELVSIEDQLFGWLRNIQCDPDFALVGPIAEKLQGMNGDIVVDRLGPGEKQPSLARAWLRAYGVRPRICLKWKGTHVSGRMSLSEAMVERFRDQLCEKVEHSQRGEEMRRSRWSKRGRGEEDCWCGCSDSCR